MKKANEKERKGGRKAGKHVNFNFDEVNENVRQHLVRMASNRKWKIMLISCCNDVDDDESRSHNYSSMRRYYVLYPACCCLVSIYTQAKCRNDIDDG